MNVRERLLTIRLMEKLRDNREYAERLGVVLPMQMETVAEKDVSKKRKS